jgi:hypothetical protein
MVLHQLFQVDETLRVHGQKINSRLGWVGAHHPGLDDRLDFRGQPDNYLTAGIFPEKRVRGAGQTLEAEIAADHRNLPTLYIDLYRQADRHPSPPPSFSRIVRHYALQYRPNRLPTKKAGGEFGNQAEGPEEISVLPPPDLFVLKAIPKNRDYFLKIVSSFEFRIAGWGWATG